MSATLTDAVPEAISGPANGPARVPASRRAGAGPAAPAAPCRPPVAVSLTLLRVDRYRIDARLGGRLVAVAIHDAYGWAVHAVRQRRWTRVSRLDGPTRWNEAMVAARLTRVALRALGG